MFEWDRNKSSRNVVKRGISFADTFGVFEDPNALTMDQIVKGEERHITIAMDAFGRLLVVSTHGVATRYASSQPEKLLDRR